ncbi:MAG: S-methyl-5-thioribose-1-phosphate isomerase [Eubacteriales bacterium]
MDNIIGIETVTLSKDGTRLRILDQTFLPGRMEYIELSKPEEIHEAIYKLRVRGAPAIGCTAAIGLYACALDIPYPSFEGFFERFKQVKDCLASSRPTAVNLFWALDKMEQCALDNRSKTHGELLDALKRQALDIRQEDIDTCLEIGRHGAALLKDGDGILTHCNAGSLATAGCGTALAPVYVGIAERGLRKLKVHCDETRPLLQGARLTAFELMNEGVDTTVLCDNMASSIMKDGSIDIIFVGCDRTASNGDAANKIGTSGVAILAKHYDVPFYVCCPTSTLDMNIVHGDGIKIEQRSPDEVSELWYTERMTPRDVKVYNPAFDVTPAEFITGIITEYGIAYPPYNKSLADIMKKKAVAGK